MNLTFLHPVKELILIIRKQDNMTSQVDGIDGDFALGKKTLGPAEKNWFAFHGDGCNPNVEHLDRRIMSTADGSLPYKITSNDSTNAGCAANNMSSKNVWYGQSKAEKYPYSYGRETLKVDNIKNRPQRPGKAP